MFLDVISASTGFFDLFTSVIGVFGTIINYLIELVSFGAQCFLNSLSFIKLFFIDFLFNYLNLFDFLPGIFGYGLSVLFYFSFVIFILNIIKKIPFL